MPTTTIDRTSNITTSTTTNPDGSKTTTVTNKLTGTVTETTTTTDGVVGKTVTTKDGSVSASATVPADVEGVVDLPVKDLPVGTTVDITASGPVTVTIPVEDCTPGVVAYLVNEDGTKEIIRTSVADGEGVTVPLDGSATIVLEDNSKDFGDLPDNYWAADAIAFVTSRELFLGVGGDLFAPNMTMTRAMLATVLYRLDGEDGTGENLFADVPDGTWYSDAVAWASSEGIILGTGSGFNPDGEITRETLAVMLYRYAGSPEVGEASLAAFPDADQVSDWAQAAMVWATSVGVINGKSGGVLDPSGTATRAEVAQMLLNFCAQS